MLWLVSESLNGSISTDKQPAGYKLPHNWLVRLGMDVAVLCVMFILLTYPECSIREY